MWRSALATAANGDVLVCATVEKPGGSLVSLSPWLIHTFISAPRPSKRVLPPCALASIAIVACPYSRWSPASTSPPSTHASSCSP